MGLQSPVEVWKKDEIAALIALFETERCLYDETDKFYNDSEEKLEAYKRIYKIMLRIRPDCTIDEVKYRIKNFRKQYVSEVFQRDVSVKAGLCTNDSYKPKMWYFHLLQFLDDYLTENVFSDLSTVENSDLEGSDDNEEVEENITRKKRKIESSSSSERGILNASSSSVKKYHSSTSEKKSHNNSSSVKKVHNTSVSQKKFRSISSLQKKRLNTSSVKKLHNSSSQKKVSNSLPSEKEPKNSLPSEKEPKNSLSSEKELKNSSSCEKEQKRSSFSEKEQKSSSSSEKERKSSSSPEKELKSSSLSEKSNSFSDLESKKESEKEIHIVSSPVDIPDSVLALNTLDREDIFGQYVATELRALRNNPLIYLQTKQSILESITSANFELLNPDS